MESEHAPDAATDVAEREPTPTICPRCKDQLDAEYYGICASCATNLRAVYAGEARDDVEAAAYEPKMNVVPNAIASKE